MSSSGTTISYCNFYDNLSSGYGGSVPTGLGTITGTNANGDPCDTYQNIFLDPLLVDPENCDFNLEEDSPCIDAGDPSSPQDPDNTVADIGSWYFDQSSTSPLEVLLTYNSGSPVPPGGGNINFAVWVENISGVAQSFDAWIDVEYEGGNPSTVALRALSNFLPGWAINRPSMNFPIPAGWAAGNYMLFGRVGAHPDEIWEESGFPFVKEGTALDLTFQPYPVAGMENLLGEDIIDAVVCPSEFQIDCYPNPFNPETTVRFTLPESGEVQLNVYDVSGQLVTQLIRGNRAAGTHELTWNASRHSSGVYIFKVQAGSSSAVRKVVVIK